MNISPMKIFLTHLRIIYLSVDAMNNHSPFINKKKALIRGTQLLNKYLKLRTNENKLTYTREIMLYLVLEKAKRNFMPI